MNNNNEKEQLLHIIEIIKDIKNKYLHFTFLVKDISVFRDKILKGELPITENEKDIVDDIYTRVNKYAKVERLASKIDYKTNTVKYNNIYNFVFDSVRGEITEEIKKFLGKNIDANDERHTFIIKVIICATLDKFIENIKEMQQTDALIYQAYKQKYYEIKNSCINNIVIDEELEIENLIDEKTEFVQ